VWLAPATLEIRGPSPSYFPRVVGQLSENARYKREPGPNWFNVRAEALSYP